MQTDYDKHMELYSTLREPLIKTFEHTPLVVEHLPKAVSGWFPFNQKSPTFLRTWTNGIEMSGEFPENLKIVKFL